MSNFLITTREQLKEHVHDMHNYMRNNGAGYGMTALKIFNVFYGLKLIEPLIDNGKMSISGDPNIDLQYKFSNMRGKLVILLWKSYLGKILIMKKIGDSYIICRIIPNSIKYCLV